MRLGSCVTQVISRVASLVRAADVSAPKLLNPLAQVRAWQDDAGYVWLAQGKELVELDRFRVDLDFFDVHIGSPFCTVIINDWFLPA